MRLSPLPARGRASGPGRGRLASAIGALVLAFVAVFSATNAAVAHGGPITVSVYPDGAGGLAVMGQYVQDGHIVDEIMDPVVTARASDGRTVGPVSLMSSSEGVGRWVTEGPILDEGTWIVTVRTTVPDLTETVIDYEVVPLAGPEVAEAAQAEAEQQRAAAAASSNESSFLVAAPIAAGVALAAVAVVVVLLVVRRSRKARAG